MPVRKTEKTNKNSFVKKSESDDHEDLLSLVMLLLQTIFAVDHKEIVRKMRSHKIRRSIPTQDNKHQH